MLRLLYLLIRQRLQRTSDRSGLRTRRDRTRRYALVIASVASAIAVATFAALNAHLLPASHADGTGERATLRLRVDAIESAPLILYLEPAERSAQIASASAQWSVRIASVNNAFEPAFQVAPVGAQIEVSNRDPVPHNTHVFSTRRRTLFNVAMPSADTAVRKPLTQPGLFEVRCDIHPWMRAWLFVTPAAPHAVLWGAGDVTLTDIVPGRYRLHEWQPSRGEAIRTVTLVSGEVASLTLSQR